jgi:hypothetical protein
VGSGGAGAGAVLRRAEDLLFLQRHPSEMVKFQLVLSV